MRPLVVLALALVAPPAVSAQLCYRARPKPHCAAFVSTNFGAFAMLGKDDWGDSPFREVADWGAMVNLGDRAAIGGSVVASLDRAGLLIGPEVTYRRWLAATASLDIGVGLPVVTSTGNIEAGSLTGLVRWSPNQWLAVAARPELLRWTTVTSCGPAGCTTASRPHARVSLGLELGHVPGAVFTGVAGTVTTLLAFWLAAIND